MTAERGSRCRRRNSAEKFAADLAKELGPRLFQPLEGDHFTRHDIGPVRAHALQRQRLVRRSPRPDRVLDDEDPRAALVYFNLGNVLEKKGDANGAIAAFEAYQEQARKNMQMFEQALSMWSPFGPNPTGLKKPDAPGTGAEISHSAGAKPAAASTSGGADELAELKAQLAAMQQKIEKLTDGRD